MSIQRKIRAPRRLDRVAALDAIQKGANALQIAKQQGLAASTVTRFLHQIREQNQSIVEFRARRADVLADLQLRASLALHRCLDDLEKHKKPLNPGQISKIVVALRHILQVTHEQERLERGESTENIRILASVVHESIKDLYCGKTPQMQQDHSASEASPVEAPIQEPMPEPPVPSADALEATT